MYHSPGDVLLPPQRTPAQTFPMQSYYSPPMSNHSSNGCADPSLQMAGPLKQDGAPLPCWRSSGSSLSSFLQQGNFSGEAPHTSAQNGGSPSLGQETSLHWANEKDGNLYRALFGATNGQTSSASSMYQQDMLSVSSASGNQPLRPVNVATPNGNGMEMDDARCSSVMLEKASFTQVLNPSDHRRQVQPASHPGMSVAVSGSASSSTISSAFETMPFAYLDSLNESRPPSNLAVQNPMNLSNNQYFPYSTQDEEFLSSFGGNFDAII